MSKIFGDFDVAKFWDQSEYAEKEYVGAPLTDEIVAAVERELGYKLPKSYIELMKYQNGGIPKKTNHRTKERTPSPVSGSSMANALAALAAAGGPSGFEDPAEWQRQSRTDRLLPGRIE